MSSSPVHIGARISHAGHIGTIRFVGQVDGTRGEWLGIEWDDAQRGKHDGVKDNKRYFSCMRPNSGSFIRPSAAGISYGTSFLKALSSKYIEALHDSAHAEKVILGSSNGAIVVEAVGLDKIRSKLSQLSNLREVSLDSQNVAFTDPHGSIRQTCPGIRGLDLSQSLIPSWDTIALVTSELSQLQRLALNQNRLTLPSTSSSHLMECAFRNLKELQLNATMTTWHDCRFVMSFMPVLELVEMGYNRLRELSSENLKETYASPPLSPVLRDNQSLRSVNFDGNALTKWTAVCHAVQPWPSLERLVLSSNEIDCIDPLPASGHNGLCPVSPLHNLKYLAISFNGLKSWSDIDHLPYWCPSLESLKATGNPLTEAAAEGVKYTREFMVAKIASLRILDAATISSAERADCERFYLSWIVKNEAQDDEETRRNKHPRWQELCSDSFGWFETRFSVFGQDCMLWTSTDTHHPQFMAGLTVLHYNHKLDKIHSGVVFCVGIRRVLKPPVSLKTSIAALELSPSSLTLRVLPTMRMRTFRMKIAKTLKLKLSRSQTDEMRLWIVMPDSSIGEIKSEREADDLAWWGVEDGSEVVLYVPT